MFTRSKSNNKPLTPDHLSTKSKSETVLLSRSTSKATGLSKGLPTKRIRESNPLRKHLKHLDFNDKENKPITTRKKHRVNSNNKEHSDIQHITDAITKTTSINCITSSPFEHSCLFWEIEWNAIEIELKTKTNGVIRSVPLAVGGHLWFVELYPKIDTASNNNNNSNTNKPNVHNCKFNFFVKSNRTPIHAKFAVYYTKGVKNEDVAWKAIYKPNILVFKKNGAGFDKIVNFSDLCTLCVDNKLRLKIEVQVFESVITKTVQQKQNVIQQNLQHKIKQKCNQIRNCGYKELLAKGSFADVILKCDSETIRAHSCILSLCSAKFAKLIDDEKKNEDNMYCVDLGSKWKDKKVVDGLLTFIYTQEIEDGVNLLELIAIGDEFEVEMLVLQCLFKLVSNADTLESNIFDIFLWTQKYHEIEEMSDIENKCLEFITCNLDQIISHKQFQSFGNKHPEIFQKVLMFMALNKSNS